MRVRRLRGQRSVAIVVVLVDDFVVVIGKGVVEVILANAVLQARVVAEGRRLGLGRHWLLVGRRWGRLRGTEGAQRGEDADLNAAARVKPDLHTASHSGVGWLGHARLQCERSTPVVRNSTVWSQAADELPSSAVSFRRPAGRSSRSRTRETLGYQVLAGFSPDVAAI